MDIRFRCPECRHLNQCEAIAVSDWQCPACEHRSRLAGAPADQSLRTCAVCANADLYRKKDFPHWLGMTILAVACLGSIIPYWLYHQWLTWTILIGSAFIDGLLYLWVGDVVVCYRCQAQYRGLQASTEHKPYELGTAERFRQERLRREQLQAAKRPN